MTDDKRDYVATTSAVFFSPLDAPPSYLRTPVSSTTASVASADTDYQNDWNSTTSNIGSPPASILTTSQISRPLSRSSSTSGISTVATKDGIEGRKVHRGRNHHLLFSGLANDMTTYNRNLLASLNREYTSTQTPTDAGDADDARSTTETSDDSQMIGFDSNLDRAPPVTLMEKMDIYESGIEKVGGLMRDPDMSMSPSDASADSA